MLNTYDNFTINSIFRPKSFIKKKHALQYQLHSLCFTILYFGTKWWNRDYVVDIEVHIFVLIKTFGQNIELRVKISYV